jgi:hypothetical protein
MVVNSFTVNDNEFEKAEHKKPVQHQRTSKKGKIFPAGHGVQNKKETRPSDEAQHYIDANTARKADAWDQTGVIDLNSENTPKEVSDFIRKLDFHNANDVYDEGHKAIPIDRFKIKTPQYFGIYVNGTPYLIDTQGYDYGRYVAEIKGLLNHILTIKK